MPGSFHPLHDGHLKLMEVATRYINLCYFFFKKNAQIFFIGQYNGLVIKCDLLVFFFWFYFNMLVINICLSMGYSINLLLEFSLKYSMVFIFVDNINVIY